MSLMASAQTKQSADAVVVDSPKSSGASLAGSGRDMLFRQLPRCGRGVWAIVNKPRISSSAANADGKQE
jgi:hypothetical protein